MDRNFQVPGQLVTQYVVPRKGDVDRNYDYKPTKNNAPVVPRKGDVDRNPAQAQQLAGAQGRPPQGGRG